MKKFPILIVLLIILSIFSYAALDDSKVQSADKLIIEIPVLDNFYVSGGEITIKENVDGDLIIAGGAISIKGDVFGDIAAAGGEISIKGDAEDIRTAGGSIDIDSVVSGDLIATGGQITLSADTIVKKDAMLSGGQIIIDGVINQDLGVSAGSVNLNGVVEGNAVIKAGDISFGENALIKGNLQLSPGLNVDESKVQGDIEYLTPPVKVSKRVAFLAGVFGKLMVFVTLLILGLLFVFVAETHLVNTHKAIEKNFWISLLTGFIVLIGMPILAIIFMITIIGIPLGLITIIIYVFSLLAGILVGAYYIGEMIFSKMDKKTSVFFTFVFGIIIYSLLKFVPILGGFIRFIIMLVGLGGCYLAFFTKKKRRKKKS